MVYHSSNVLKEPVVRTISYELDVFLVILKIALVWTTAAQITPAAGDDCANPDCLHGLEYSFREFSRVVNNDAPKTDVYRRWAATEEFRQFRWWIVLRGFAEKEAANVYTRFFYANVS